MQPTGAMPVPPSGTKGGAIPAEQRQRSDSLHQMTGSASAPTTPTGVRARGSSELAQTFEMLLERFGLDQQEGALILEAAQAATEKSVQLKRSAVAGAGEATAKMDRATSLRDSRETAKPDVQEYKRRQAEDERTSHDAVRRALSEIEGLALTEAQLGELSASVAELVIQMEEIFEKQVQERKRDEFNSQKEIERWTKYMEKKTRKEVPIPNFFQVRVILPDRLQSHTVSCSSDTTIKTLLETCIALPEVQRFKQERGETVKSLVLRVYGTEQEWLENRDVLLTESKVVQHWLKRSRVPVLLLAADPDMRMAHSVNRSTYEQVSEEVETLLGGSDWHTGSEEAIHFQRTTSALAASRRTHIPYMPFTRQQAVTGLGGARRSSATEFASPSLGGSPFGSPFVGSAEGLFLGRGDSLEDVATAATACRASSPPALGSKTKEMLSVQIEFPKSLRSHALIELVCQAQDKLKDVIAKCLDRMRDKERDLLPGDVTLRLAGSEVDLYEEDTLGDLRSPVDQLGVIQLEMVHKLPLDPDVLLEAAVFPMAMQGAVSMADKTLAFFETTDGDHTQVELPLWLQLSSDPGIGVTKEPVLSAAVD